MLTHAEFSSWIAGGGHMHSAQPLMGGITLMSGSLRSSSVPDLAEVFGEAQSGKCLLIKAIESLYAANPTNPGDIFSQVVQNDLYARQDLHEFIETSIGDGYSKAKDGRGMNDTIQTHEQLGPSIPAEPPQWRAAFHARPFNVKINNRATAGARFVVGYHDDLLSYGSLDTEHDLESGILHNPREGVGGQANNFYSQWVQFRRLDNPTETDWSVFNPGNSLHPLSIFFDSNQDMWERDNLYFNLQTAQSTPTLYFRQAPLQ